MAGHSKWKNIMHRKSKTDAQRAKIFTKIGREMMVVIKEGGSDPTVNGKLRDLIAKAKQHNVPNENIERIIKRASGNENKHHYETMVYEGYGPNGVAVIVEALTDNKNRTAAEVRHAFDKYGGKLATTGCVSYLFSKKGIIMLQNDGVTEDQLMEDCMKAGANDFEWMAEVINIETDPTACGCTREALEGMGYVVLSSEVMQIPSMLTALNQPEQIRNMNTLLNILEENDDVQHVFHNWENPVE